MNVLPSVPDASADSGIFVNRSSLPANIARGIAGITVIAIPPDDKGTLRWHVASVATDGSLPTGKAGVTFG